MEKTKKNWFKAILRGNKPFELIEKSGTASRNNVNLARAMSFFMILLLSITLVSAGNVTMQAGDFDIGGQLDVVGNITSTKDVDISGYYYGDASRLSNLPSGMDYTNVAMTNKSNSFTANQIFSSGDNTGRTFFGRYSAGYPWTVIHAGVSTVADESLGFDFRGDNDATIMTLLKTGLLQTTTDFKLLGDVAHSFILQSGSDYGQVYWDNTNKDLHLLAIDSANTNGRIIFKPDGQQTLLMDRNKKSWFYGDVDVTGSVFMGWERVESHGSSTTIHNADCSSGKKIIGGGCYCTDSGRYIEFSYPYNDTRWACKYSASCGTLTARAICARIGN